jgi:hypothetical protein
MGAAIPFPRTTDNIFEYLRVHLAKGQQAISLEGQSFIGVNGLRSISLVVGLGGR